MKWYFFIFIIISTVLFFLYLKLNWCDSRAIDFIDALSNQEKCDIIKMNSKEDPIVITLESNDFNDFTNEFIKVCREHLTKVMKERLALQFSYRIVFERDIEIYFTYIENKEGYIGFRIKKEDLEGTIIIDLEGAKSLQYNLSKWIRSKGRNSKDLGEEKEML